MNENRAYNTRVFRLRMHHTPQRICFILCAFSSRHHLSGVLSSQRSCRCKQIFLIGQPNLKIYPLTEIYTVHNAHNVGFGTSSAYVQKTIRIIWTSEKYNFKAQK